MSEPIKGKPRSRFWLWFWIVGLVLFGGGGINKREYNQHQEIRDLQRRVAALESLRK